VESAGEERMKAELLLEAHQESLEVVNELREEYRREILNLNLLLIALYEND